MQEFNNIEIEFIYLTILYWCNHFVSCTQFTKL